MKRSVAIVGVALFILAMWMSSGSDGSHAAETARTFFMILFGAGLLVCVCVDVVNLWRR